MAFMLYFLVELFLPNTLKLVRFKSKNKEKILASKPISNKQQLSFLHDNQLIDLPLFLFLSAEDIDQLSPWDFMLVAVGLFLSCFSRNFFGVCEMSKMFNKNGNSN